MASYTHMRMLSLGGTNKVLLLGLFLYLVFTVLYSRNIQIISKPEEAEIFHESFNIKKQGLLHKEHFSTSAAQIDSGNKISATTPHVNSEGQGGSEAKTATSYTNGFKNNRSFTEFSCSDVPENSRYGDLIAANTRAWHKIIPESTRMDSNNCWHSNHLNTLPSSLREKMARVKSFINLQKLFSKDEVDGIMSKIVRSNNGSDLSPHGDYFFCLPKIFMIGFPKCGTTLMHNNFKVHQNYAIAHWKEPHFWRDLVRNRDKRYKELDVLLYLFHFYEPSQNIKERQEVFITDDSTSTVHVSAQPFEQEKDTCVVPMTMFNIFPSAKFMITMRNPIDLLWSDFWFFCFSMSRFRSPAAAMETFHRYTVTALTRFKECIREKPLLYCATVVSSNVGEDISCKEVRLGLSIYYVHIRRWLSVYPREQFLIIKFEDWISNFSTTMENVWSFIGVSPASKSVDKKVNPNPWANHFKTSKFEMLPKTRTLLREFYLPYNNMLVQLLDDRRYLLWNEN